MAWRPIVGRRGELQAIRTISDPDSRESIREVEEEIPVLVPIARVVILMRFVSA
jgi:hypothetical protein